MALLTTKFLCVTVLLLFSTLLQQVAFCEGEGFSRGDSVEEEIAEVLRPEEEDASDSFGAKEGTRHQTSGGAEDSDPPRLKRVDLENFCFGRGDSLPLGPCSSIFLRCGTSTHPFAFEECPLGSVFDGKECKQARKVRQCFQAEVNLLNDATEKLAQAVDFCARHDPFDATLHFFDGPLPEHKCSRQAVICRGTANRPLALGCPSGKVLDLNKLSCDEAPEECALIAGGASTTPIRQQLLRLYCAQSKLTTDEARMPPPPPLFPHTIQATKKEEEEEEGKATRQSQREEQRCRNWYVVCEANPELVFCDNGKMFDASKRTCRRVLPEDRCPHIGVCLGWEYRMSVLGDCRRDFLFCNGLRAQLFQCRLPGDVFKDGACIAADAAQCDVCRPGQTRRSADRCEEFLFCERNTVSGHLHWRQYICTDGRVFNPQQGECVQPDAYQCPTRTQCQEGDSYSVECGDFFLCVGDKFVPGKCPDRTKWESIQRRCVYAPECRRFQESGGGLEGSTTAVDGQSDGKCTLEGQTKPSGDCKQFEECAGGRWQKRRCRDYGNGKLKSPCRFCSRHPVEGEQQQMQQKSPDTTYPLERLLPDNFNPFEQQGIRHRSCVESEKIVNRHDCSRFMECIDGEWFSLSCPLGHYFSPRAQGCVLASSSNSSAMPMCQELFLNSLTTDLGSSDQGTPFRMDSVYLLPAVPNDTLTGPGAGPMPELGDQELRQNYADVFDLCDQQSARRLANPYDCSRYRECALNSGGYYTDKQCAPGKQFDPKLMQCARNYTCSPANCVEGMREPLRKCGRARLCKDGQWSEFSCAHGMAFVDGQCSQRVRCRSTNPLLPAGGSHCTAGHTRTHPTDCAKYLLCRYGQFVEENCNNGHRYNPTIGRCDPTYVCPAGLKPPCYEGEMRSTAAALGDSSSCRTEYELCRDGQFEQMNCPFGEHFDGTQCAVMGQCVTNGQYEQQRDGQQQGNKGGYEKTEKCKESPSSAGFRADRADCARFYQCAQGNWVRKECAKGTVFNPALSVCDWPANVPGC